ncbi:MAG TPA: type VI secretion system accessory protein TagJ [Gemmatimonas sp.]|uniref:type VI secretion system accessory protein TagJ n=1 Tax=Gemmatimonas sp. TaxID=1962908 RepID=UPI002EDAE0D6
MATAQTLYAAGQLGAAIETLGVELRSNPADAQRRTFLFELLTFTGDWVRAEKQLDVLAKNGHMAEAGTMLYRSAIEAERVREHMFESGDFPTDAAPSPVSGTLNGEAFSSIEDADPRVGARLEVIAGGRYLWIPFAHIASIGMQAPTRLRDLHWPSAHLRTGPSVRDLELGEVLLPALSPGAGRLDDDELRLGRAADWEELPSGDFAPIGQKMLRVDERLIPLVDIRELLINS